MKEEVLIVAGVVVIFGSAEKRRNKKFTKENTGKKKKDGGWSAQGMDQMESLEKEIRMDQGEDPGNGERVLGTTGDVRDRC